MMLNVRQDFPLFPFLTLWLEINKLREATNVGIKLNNKTPVENPPIARKKSVAMVAKITVHKI